MEDKRDDLPREEALLEEEVEIIDETKENFETKDLTEDEIRWYKEVYKGDSMKQLTFRAVIMGAFLGGFMSLSNLYVGLKTGWGLGVAITSCILSYAIWKALMVVFPKIFKTEMTVLENNCMQSTASSAGYSTGGTLTSAIAAYLLITGVHMSWVVLTLWTIFLAALGVFIAIPMKKQMINVEKLKFPSGIAAAETLKSLHSTGADASDKAKALGVGGLFGAVIVFFRDGIPTFFNKELIPQLVSLPVRFKGFMLKDWTISFELSAIMIAAGAIIGWKIGWSMLLGGIINYGILAPWMVQLGSIDPSKLNYRTIVQWSTWAGASIMVTSAIFMFLLQWKTIARAMSGLKGIFSFKNQKKGYVSSIEVPMSWFLTGTFIAGIGCIMVLHFAFSTSWWMGVIAVLLTFVLAVVAARATGESDITPIGAMGKITQLTFGVIAPTNMVTNLMTASVTAGAAGSSADLLTDLKSGYLLGANPRKQFIAQFLGIFAGTIVVVPAFYLLVPDASSLGTDRWPAPSAQVWAAVARLLSNGITSLPITARWGMLIGGLIGIIIPLIEIIFPKHKKYIPSAMGLGLSMVIPFYNSLSIFIGSFIALLLEKKLPKIAEKYIVPVSSGIIAGESLMGVFITLYAARSMVSDVWKSITAVFK